MRTHVQVSDRPLTTLATLQILERHPEAKLLLCAPQNYSADLLASALCQAGVTAPEMLRLNDPRRPPNQVRPCAAHLAPSCPRVLAMIEADLRRFVCAVWICTPLTQQ